MVDVFLEQRHTLEALDLGSNRLTRAAIPDLIRLIREGSLKHVILSHNRLLFHNLSDMTLLKSFSGLWSEKSIKLRALELRDCGLFENDDENIANEIFQALERNQSLERIELGHNRNVSYPMDMFVSSSVRQQLLRSLPRFFPKFKTCFF